VITAEITCSSKLTPMLGWPDPSRADIGTPANAAERPLST
jgi:hypothetical protein